MNRLTWIAALGAALASPVLAQTVKVTPLGGVDGEFCPQDRALVFEDQTARASCTTRAAPSRARTIRDWARSTSFSSRTCTATTWATPT